MSGRGAEAEGGGVGARRPEPLERLVEQLTRLPGIGRRSAERIAFHLLKVDAGDAMALSRAIADLKQRLGQCSICHNLCAGEVCPICSSPGRDPSMVLVVEQPRDLIGLEQAGTFTGVYHVLMGRLDPLGGVGPDDLNVQTLVARVTDPGRNARGVAVAEVILGLNPDLEGDTTALYLADRLAATSVKVTRLARGLPAGSQLQFASRTVLADAISGRREIE